MEALEQGHVQYVAGWDAGYLAGVRRASAELARDMLHADARRWTEQAATLAESRHGIGWSESIRAAAEAAEVAALLPMGSKLPESQARVAVERGAA